MATYDDSFTAVDGTVTSFDIVVNNKTVIESASLAILNANSPGGPAELLLVNKSRNKNAGYLNSGRIWRSDLLGKVFWAGRKIIPSSEEYVVRASVRNDTGADFLVSISVQDDQP